MQWPTPYANLLKDTGSPQEAIGHYQTALALNPASADAHNNLGLLYREHGQFEAAVQSLEQALQADPGNPRYRLNLRDTYRRMIPAWHFAMLNDQARNDAFERAIAKAARGRRLVLDIGTGSGLLAMMAARVVACEAKRPVEIRVTADGTAQAGRVLVRPAARRRHHTVDAPGRRQQALAPSPHLLRARPPGAARRDAAADRRPHRQPFLLPLA